MHAYDALHDRRRTGCGCSAFAVPTDRPASFHRPPATSSTSTPHSTLFTGEQSNTSVAFGEDALMKVFRRITPGTNPDIEVHEALTAAGREHVARPATAGSRPSTTARRPSQLAMLQQFLRTASDGWDLALASVRDLFAEADLHADEVGGDFAGEAERLGAALRRGARGCWPSASPTGTRPAAGSRRGAARS